jgi:hypothetical protein
VLHPFLERSLWQSKALDPSCYPVVSDPFIHHGEIVSGFDEIEDIGHPKVLFPGREATKRLSKSKIADNIKGASVVPHHHLQGLIFFDSVLPNLLDQHIDVVMDDILLFRQGFGGE